jgi:hypothetical protein
MPTALNDLLKATSRSFYLTLRVLPARHREFPASFQDAFHFRLFPETASLANIRGRAATKHPVHIHVRRSAPWLVPKAQPEISQTRSVWYRGKGKPVLKGRRKHLNDDCATKTPSSFQDE